MADNLLSVDDFVSYPHTEDEVTARGLATFMAVEAHWSASLNTTLFQAMMAAYQASGGPTDAAALYNQNQSLMLSEHGVAFLLRALILHVPDKADEIAAELWNDWEDAPLVALTWPVLEALGGDPQAVGEAAVALYKAEREIPAGGAS